MKLGTLVTPRRAVDDSMWVGPNVWKTETPRGSSDKLFRAREDDLMIVVEAKEITSWGQWLRVVTHRGLGWIRAEHLKEVR